MKLIPEHITFTHLDSSLCNVNIKVGKSHTTYNSKKPQD